MHDVLTNIPFLGIESWVESWNQSSSHIFLISNKLFLYFVQVLIH